MKYRSIIAIALLLILLISGCNRLFGTTQPAPIPTEAGAPPVPDFPTGPVITVTSEGGKALPTAEAIPTATPVIVTAVPQPVVNTPVVVPTTAPTAAPTVAVPAPAANYPGSAEEVVSALLTAYQESPADMLTYLSSGYAANLPAGGAAEAAQLGGTLESFTIQSGAANMNPPYAVVQVSIRLNGVDTVRIFQLIQENGLWKINMVDIARG